MKFKVDAPAKINIGLWIIGERPDGYHEIKTFYHKITLFDTVEGEESEKLDVISTEGPQGEDNLIFAAIKKLEERIERPVNIRFFVTKNIPLGGGLGGGSTDTAAALKIAKEILKIELSDEELMEIGKEVGSDVPFFLHPSSIACGEGRGDIIYPIPSILSANVIIVFPGFPVSTAWAYGEIKKRGYFSKNVDTTIEKVKKAFVSGNLNEISNLCVNELEKIVFENYPEISRVKKILLESGARLSMLSGSGSSVFALFDKEIPPIEFPPHYKIFRVELGK